MAEATNQPDAEGPAVNRADAEAPAVNRADAEAPAVNRADAEAPAVNRADAEAPAVNRADAEAPAVDRADAEAPAVDRADAEAPAGPAAVVGAGVIGAAWAARMVLSGRDVRVADPAADAATAAVEAALVRAATAWGELGLPIDPDRWGDLIVTDDIAAAVAGAAFVQESVPERPGLKAEVLAAIESAAPPATVIASSTSGIRPTVLQETMSRPERLVVGHPFNPVYLLPLVEVVGGERTAPDAIETAQAFYRTLGMKPLHVRVEIDAFIADRLLEAVWREALWLVNDGVATTAEIDDAVTYGFGLRWAQMGVFETYRTAGGAGGFRHFIEQFGPTLEWPWTKLMDTPEFTPELVDTIVEQSDEQSGHHRLDELERIRDRNLVGFLEVLEQNRWGAGLTLSAQRATLDRP